MADAFDVAKFLIQLAAAEDEPEQLTHLRLQKLLYYVQGWSLALTDKPMFAGRIEAWAHGPVVKQVYPKFADWGSLPIPHDKVLAPEKLSEDEREIIGSVWEAYKGYSASALREMTHSESPWKIARGNIAPEAKCENEITVDLMREHFSALAKKA
ncbi:MAG: Panacea domain-containing protein [Phycisphaerae bacterium]